MNNYLYIVPFVLILILTYLYFSKCEETNITFMTDGTDYYKAFQKVKGDREITIFIFSAPCDRTKYTSYGQERNIKTNKGVGFVSGDYYDSNNYYTLAERKELVEELSKEGYVEVFETTNSDGTVVKLEDSKDQFYIGFDKEKCK